MKAVTQWFSANVNPVHVGWYRACYGGDLSEQAMRYWDGSQWRNRPEGKISYFAMAAFKAKDCWCGLAEKP